eukprot:TRINITY_DN6536_c0_g1_i1.p2 TRINITY_DN6536_c0_g1~~TRINITY_DN6536_c0_g1_i1.p2  ORF type:complete len:55 (+),score=3.33 TRINITY_DN6536_c0_g1_i1:388-552(+)
MTFSPVPAVSINKKLECNGYVSPSFQLMTFIRNLICSSQQRRQQNYFRIRILNL